MAVWSARDDTWRSGSTNRVIEMKRKHEETQIDEALLATWKAPPSPDFATWRERHAAELASLNPSQVSSLVERRKKRQRFIRFSVTAALAATIVLGISLFGGEDVPTFAYAEVNDQLKQAKSATWKIKSYNEVVGEDGQTKWIQVNKIESAYLAPGRYRDDRFDADGRPTSTVITDNEKLKKILLYMPKRRAELRELTEARIDQVNPFNLLTKEMENRLKWVETRKVGQRTVNVFRWRNKFKGPYRGKPLKNGYSLDFWMDADTKELIRYQSPGSDLFDPDKDPLMKTKPQERISGGTSLGFVVYDIKLNADLDESFFELKAPEGFELTVHRRFQITEAEMIAFLNVLAEVNQKKFPPTDEMRPMLPDIKVVNRIYKIPEKERTESEKKVIAKIYEYSGAKIGHEPFGLFINDKTERGTWRYIGAGVKLGDAGRIVCYYQLKQNQKFRAVYGDLSVKDIDPAELPKNSAP